jgi:hypothetical protein
VSNVSLEADGVNGDESSDDELPSLQKLLSPIMSLSGNPPRSHSLNQSVQTTRSSATTPSGLTSTPRGRLFNYPEWSFFQYPPTQALTEANDGNSQSRLMILDSAVAKLMIDRESYCRRRR